MSNQQMNALLELNIKIPEGYALYFQECIQPQQQVMISQFPQRMNILEKDNWFIEIQFHNNQFSSLFSSERLIYRYFIANQDNSNDLLYSQEEILYQGNRYILMSSLQSQNIHRKEDLLIESQSIDLCYDQNYKIKIQEKKIFHQIIKIILIIILIPIIVLWIYYPIFIACVLIYFIILQCIESYKGFQNQERLQIEYSDKLEIDDKQRLENERQNEIEIEKQKKQEVEYQKKQEIEKQKKEIEQKQQQAAKEVVKVIFQQSNSTEKNIIQSDYTKSIIVNHLKELNPHSQDIDDSQIKFFAYYKVTQNLTEKNPQQINQMEQESQKAYQEIEKSCQKKDIQEKENSCEVAMAGVYTIYKKLGFKVQLTKSQIQLDEDDKVGNAYQSQIILKGQTHNLKYLELKIQDSSKLSFDQIENDDNQKKQFIQKFLQAASQQHNISQDKIQIIDLSKESIKVKYKITNLDQTELDQLVKKGNEAFKQHFDSVTLNIKSFVDHFQIHPKMFDPKYNKYWNSSYSYKDFRGGFTLPNGTYSPQLYKFPVGFHGYGLNVSKSLLKDKAWLQANSNPTTWIVLFHGTPADNVKTITDDGLKSGYRNVYGGSTCRLTNQTIKYSHCENTYYSDDIQVCVDYAGDGVQIGSKKYILVFQCRVNPEHVRSPVECPSYYTVEEQYVQENVRPYRILVMDNSSSKQQNVSKDKTLNREQLLNFPLFPLDLFSSQGNFQILSDKFNPRFNKYWGNDFSNKKEYRGGFKLPNGEYKPQRYNYPVGYYGYALNIDKYLTKDQKWLDQKPDSSTWIVLYHGTPAKFIEPILFDRLKSGQNNSYGGYACRLTGQIIAAGNYSNTYFIDNAAECEDYSKKGSSPVQIGQKEVNPQYVRSPIDYPNYYTVEEKYMEENVRIIRILVKEI